MAHQLLSPHPSIWDPGQQQQQPQRQHMPNMMLVMAGSRFNLRPVRYAISISHVHSCFPCVSAVSVLNLSTLLFAVCSKFNTD